MKRMLWAGAAIGLASLGAGAVSAGSVVGTADIALSKVAGNSSPGLGNVVFTVTATNNGPAAATGVQVSDPLPAGLAFVSAVPSTGSYASGTGLWTIGSLAVGASASLTLTATVTRPGAVVNQATKSAQGEADPLGSNNTAAERLNSAPVTDIQVALTVDDDTPGIGQDVFFLVTAKNAGPIPQTNVTLNSNLPAGLSLVSSTPSQGSYAPGSGSWSVGVLGNGAAATLSLQMTNTGATPVTQTFTQAAGNLNDLVTGNDAASVTLNPLTALADLALTKLAMVDPAAAGLNFNYLIVATNLGPGSATGVTVTDTLPAGTTLVSAASSQGSCSGTATVVCSLGSLLAGGGATIDLVVTKTVGGAVANTASVAGAEADPNPANNSKAATTTPVDLTNFSVE